MRICITRSEQYVYSETFIRNIIEGLSEHHEVYNIHSGRYPERKEDGSLLSPKPFWLFHKFIKAFVGRNNYFSNYGVKKFLKDNKIEAVFANYGMAGAHMVPVCKALNIPLVVIFHGHDATDKKYLKKYAKGYQKLFGYASAIVAVSAVMKQKLIEQGAKPEKIHLVPYGIDLSKFKPSSTLIGDQNFLAVGRFAEKKGPLYTIRAFHRVFQKYPDARLTMVGGKTGLYNECKELVDELKLKDSVLFPGILGQDEIADMMRSSLSFVQHSIIAPNGDMEGTPLSILEAGACGIPIVSTLHGGIMEAVVHGETGYLVEEHDDENMGNYMIRLCDDTEQAKKMGMKGRKHIEKNYQNTEQIKKLANLLEIAASNH